MKNKAILYSIFLVCVVALPTFLIASSVTAFAGSDSLYKWGFNQYRIAESTGISEIQLDRAGEAMARYLAGWIESPQIKIVIDDKERSLYNEKEITHLVDVRSIIIFFQILLLLSIVILITTGILLFRLYGVSKMLDAIILGALVAMVSTGIIITWALIDFDSLFYLFHIMSFNNDLWLLDPSKDYLIRLFPEGFFNTAAILLIGTIVSAAIIILGIAVHLKKSATADANKPRHLARID